MANTLLNQNINLNLPVDEENGSLRRMGLRLTPKEGEIFQEDYSLYNAVVG